MYEFKVTEKVKNYIIECISMLKKMDIPISENIFFNARKGYSFFGTCYKNKKNNNFVISINVSLLYEKDYKETIIHELLHTVENCYDHKKKWKEYAELCSEKLNLDIDVRSFRYTVTDGNKIDEPDIEIKSISITNQFNYLNNLLKNNIDYLFKNTHQIMCYLTKENRDYLFLYCHENMPYIFWNHKYAHIRWVIHGYSTRKSRHKLALDYMSGKYDYLNFTFEEWCWFSEVWSLTMDYVYCNDRYYKMQDEYSKNRNMN